MIQLVQASQGITARIAVTDKKCFGWNVHNTIQPLVETIKIRCVITGGGGGGRESSHTIKLRYLLTNPGINSELQRIWNLIIAKMCDNVDDIWNVIKITLNYIEIENFDYVQPLLHTFDPQMSIIVTPSSLGNCF